MMKCIGKKGFLSCPAGVVVGGLGMVAVAALQWPIAQAVLCKAGPASAAVAAPDGEALAATAAQPAEADLAGEADSEAVPAQTAWREDLGAALDEAAAQGKPVLAYFTADWCPPCQVMKQQVWPRQEIRQRLHADYVPVLLDVDQPRNIPVGQRYGIRVIPTILVLNAQGEVQQSGSFMSVEAMMQFLDQGSGRG